MFQPIRSDHVIVSTYSTSVSWSCDESRLSIHIIWSIPQSRDVQGRKLKTIKYSVRDTSVYTIPNRFWPRFLLSELHTSSPSALVSTHCCLRDFLHCIFLPLLLAHHKRHSQCPTHLATGIHPNAFRLLALAAKATTVKSLSRLLQALWHSHCFLQLHHQEQLLCLVALHLCLCLCLHLCPCHKNKWKEVVTWLKNSLIGRSSTFATVWPQRTCRQYLVSIQFAM